MALIRFTFVAMLALVCQLVSAAGHIAHAAPAVKTPVLIIGGGASGTMAGIQCARLGVPVLILEETTWLGGMLTSAGVSAIDGNHQLPSGLWGEFRQQLYNYYGGPQAVQTGWVSNTLFEPSVANRILKEMAGREKPLSIWYNTRWLSVERSGDRWIVTAEREGKRQTIETTILIDATELGDVLAKAGARYRIGMDSRFETGEKYAPDSANTIIQDLTYVVTLKDYGAGADKTIPRPAGYDSTLFLCSCSHADPSLTDKPEDNCHKMLQYGRLPNKKYMINWPACGNDYYLNVIEKSPAERRALLEEARLHTLRFLYYMQTALGYRNLGIADDEYPTNDRLPMIPYYREARRVQGLVTFSYEDMPDPWTRPVPLYRTGIAVGDYPIDHHHLKYPAAPQIDFVKIKVPSYNVPMGSLIPEGVSGLIVAEKSISVTNIVNGATRLQPVVLQLGQAAGIMAALCIRQHRMPDALAVRDVQQQLLLAGGYLMPYIDVKKEDSAFAAIQRIGATGILHGVGVPFKWANQTWFYPELPVSRYELVMGLRSFFSGPDAYRDASGALVDGKSLLEIIRAFRPSVRVDNGSWLADLQQAGLRSDQEKLSRRAVAILLDKYIQPFEIPVDIRGKPSL